MKVKKALILEDNDVELQFAPQDNGSVRITANVRLGVEDAGTTERAVGEMIVEGGDVKAVGLEFQAVARTAAKAEASA